MHVVHEVPTTVVHVRGTQVSKQVGGIDLPKLRRDIERFETAWQTAQQEREEEGEDRTPHKGEPPWRRSSGRGSGEGGEKGHGHGSSR
jgi:hypothetical protein